MDFTPQRFGFLQMNQYDLEDLDPTRLQHTDGGCAAILDQVQRLKLIGNLCIASMRRRPAKFGRNWSSCAGDIKYFSKSKMAAVPPFWI